jgi:type IV pilus assembly protein PilB
MRVKLGDTLVKIGVINRDQLKQALKECDPEQRTLGQVLVALGYTTEDKILKGVSLSLGIPCFTSFEGMLEPEVAHHIPEALARRHLVVPILQTDEGLTVGMVNPVDIIALDDLERHTGLKIHPVMTTLPTLLQTIQTLYAGTAPKKTIGITPERRVVQESIGADAEADSVVTAVDRILEQAMIRKASDVHVQPAETQTRVRYRVDGLLQDGETFEKTMEASLIARIKILSRLDITETRLPQDGRLRFVWKEKAIDVRVSTVPGVNGEKIVMRILDSSRTLQTLKDLGLAPDLLEAFGKAIRQSNRIILVTGPTGSGKTTTLYGALAELNDATCNIVTLEDPVEYRVDRITQIEANSKVGLTFATGLRAILRQDPNVILVGEIRDIETAEISVQAAITGHRVFSTLHTSDAVTAIHRLITMRVEPFLIAAALGGVMAQRLVRRLCEVCKKAHTLESSEQAMFGNALKANATFFDAVGCSTCFGTGYAGRIAVHEWLPVTSAIRELILKRVSVDELRAAAQSQGMRSLRDDAFGKASQGLTSLTEVLRVIQQDGL